MEEPLIPQTGVCGTGCGVNAGVTLWHCHSSRGRHRVMHCPVSPCRPWLTLTPRPSSTHRPPNHVAQPRDEGLEPLHHQLRRMRSLHLGPDLPLRLWPALRLAAGWAGPPRRPGAVHQVGPGCTARVQLRLAHGSGLPPGRPRPPPSRLCTPSVTLPEHPGPHRAPSQGASRGNDPGAHPAGGRRRGGPAGRRHPQHRLLLRAKRRAHPRGPR